MKIYEYTVKEAGRYLKSGSCTESFKKTFETIINMDLFRGDVVIEFEQTQTLEKEKGQ